MVRCGIQTGTGTALVAGTRVLVCVAAAGLDIDVLVGRGEGYAVDGTGVAFVLAQWEIGQLARNVAHVCHWACGCVHAREDEDNVKKGLHDD
jgi:hypothetical protein